MVPRGKLDDALPLWHGCVCGIGRKAFAWASFLPMMVAFRTRGEGNVLMIVGWMGQWGTVGRGWRVLSRR
jgi:hypothetical protein